MKRHLIESVSIVLALFCLAAGHLHRLPAPSNAAALQTPEVIKVEPPNWWAGH